MNFPKIKSKLRFQYIIIIILVSLNLSSSNTKSNRFLQYNGYYGETNNNEQQKEEDKRKASLDEDPGTFFLAWFFIYFLMGLYIICVLKKIPQVADKTDYVWKFMFFANNGILVASFFNFLSFKNILMDSSPFALSLIGFGIGCAYYIYKFTKNCNANYAYEYFEYEKLSEFFNLPCFIWNLVGLTDPCCREDRVSIYIDSNGRLTDNSCCVCCWNWFITIMKRLATIFSIVSYYIFVLFYLVFWFAGKGILILIFKCKNIKVEDESAQNPENKTNPDIDQNQGNQVINNQNNLNNNNFQISEKQIENNNNIPNYDININNNIPLSNQMGNNGELSEANRFQNNAQNLNNTQTLELPDKTQLEAAMKEQKQNIEKLKQDENIINQENLQGNNINELKEGFKPDNNMEAGPNH